MSYLEQLFSLDGKVALITGAAGGLGGTLTKSLLSAGATTVLVDDDQQRLDEARAEYQQDGLDAQTFACDLTDSIQLDALVAYVESTHGRADVLVNCAGVTTPHDSVDYPDELWSSTMRLNLDAPFQLSKRIARLMIAQGAGSMIHITSINAEQGFAFNPAYQASKGGLRSLSKSLARDLGPHGIRSNTVGPGYFETSMHAGRFDDPVGVKARAARTMLGRVGQPPELAGIVVLLASDAATYITGQDIYVDGGWLARGF